MPGRTPTRPRPPTASACTSWNQTRTPPGWSGGSSLSTSPAAACSPLPEGLTRDGIASPSQHDRARNRHRTGEGWSKSAVRAIVCNPRYTGRQVWNRQRKDEILLDVNDVAAGYETRMRWNQAGSWVWSDAIAHEPLIPAADFEAAQAVMAGAGRARRGSREAHQRVTRPYVLRGRLYCGYCGRRMQGQYSNQAPYYRCRYPREYALASHVQHPGNVYLREADLLPAIDCWLLVIFAPYRLEQTIREMHQAQAPPVSPRSPKTPRPSSPTATPGSSATRPPSTPEPTPEPSPSGPGRSRTSAPPRSPATPARTATQPSASSPKTTSALSSPASVTSVTSSTTPRPP
ncbi:MAG TPA: recombinase family protein [Streptosporangiaceae bacterium]